MGRTPEFIWNLGECGFAAVGGGIVVNGSKDGSSAAQAARRDRSLRGLEWEAHAVAEMKRRGLEVFAMTHGSPYDALVNGRRVDVKSAVWTDYKQRRGRVRGYVFTSIKECADCDALVLVCHDGAGVATAWFVVPADAARVQTITITPASFDGGPGKWAPYLDAWAALQ